MIRIKPYKGKYCTRKMANFLNDFFASLQPPDRTQLEQEAAEFRQLMLNRRSSKGANIK